MNFHYKVVLFWIQPQNAFINYTFIYWVLGFAAQYYSTHVNGSSSLSTDWISQNCFLQWKPSKYRNNNLSREISKLHFSYFYIFNCYIWAFYWDLVLYSATLPPYWLLCCWWDLWISLMMGNVFFRIYATKVRLGMFFGVFFVQSNGH